jgi:trehalose 6-phosphate phosphatase
MPHASQSEKAQMTDLPAPAKPLDALFASLEHARRALLMLDYDGTLAPFRVDPAQARPYPGIVEQLDAIMHEGNTRIVVVTGRSAVEIGPLLGTRMQPEVWGAHGWERLLPNGVLTIERAPQVALDALIAASTSADRAQRLGARIERKPSSLALHWRGLPRERVLQLRAAVEQEWVALCTSAPLALLEFDGGIELRASGRTKADAAITVLQECDPDTPAAFLGDDITDEDAFLALHGKALGILVRPEPRPTAAEVWLRPPAELAAFLQRWQRARQTSRSSGEVKS